MTAVVACGSATAETNGVPVSTGRLTGHMRSCEVFTARGRSALGWFPLRAV